MQLESPNLGSLSNGVPALVNTNKTVTTAGSAFSLTESYQAGMTIRITKFWYCFSSSFGWSEDSISAGTGNLALTSVSSDPYLYGW